MWASLSAGQTSAVCPTPAIQGNDIEVVRGHLDAYLKYMSNKRAELSSLNGDPELFAFLTYIVPSNDIFFNLADTYDNALLIIYFLGRADDEVANLPRAACYLNAAVDTAKTFMRRMRDLGYDPALSTPDLRLGSYNGLYARYPATLDLAAGDLGNNACA